MARAVSAFALFGVVAVLAGAIDLSAQDAARANADSMTRKLAGVMARGAVPPSAHHAPVRTSFTDDEINAYFRIDGHDFLPPGLVDPQLATGDGGRVRAHAVVDIATIRKSRPQSFFDPLTLLPNTADVRVIGVVHGADGMGRVTIESVSVGGFPVPVTVLQLLVTHYSETPENPQGADLNQPFPLPSNIVAVEIQRGTSTVVQ